MILINNLILIIAFLVTNVLLLGNILKIIKLNLLNNDLLFIYLTNLILLSTVLIFYFIFSKIMISFYLSLFLMIFSYLLVYNIKNILKKDYFYCIPYFIICVINFAQILIIYLF